MTAQSSLFAKLVGLVARINPPDPPTQAQNTSALLARLSDDYNSKIDALTRGLEQGTISIGQFTGAMPSLIKQHHLAAAIIAGGGADHATPETLTLAQRQVDVQLAYFERWKTELLQQATDGTLPTPAMIANRATLYGRAASATASEARTQALGIPPLPFYVGQGTTCKVNCKCRWDIEVMDVVNSNYDCYWYLGDAEHCPVCVARSQAASPLRVRGGKIIDPERYQVAGLYA